MKGNGFLCAESGHTGYGRNLPLFPFLAEQPNLSAYLGMWLLPRYLVTLLNYISMDTYREQLDIGFLSPWSPFKVEIGKCPAFYLIDKRLTFI